MTAMPMLRPMAIAGYDENGARRLMPVSDRELHRTQTFLHRVLRSEPLRRNRYALIVSTMRDLAHMMPFEAVLMSMGLICCSSEANLYDGMRIESTIRRFDIQLVAVVTGTVMQAIRNAGFDPVRLFQGKIVWASGEGHDQLRGTSGIDLRRWITLGPALAIEGQHGEGAHLDGREWNIEPDGDVTYVSSRLDRAQSFDRLRIDLPVQLNTEPCASGAYGPRIVL